MKIGYTKYGYRINHISVGDQLNWMFNWIFLPGGPGLGSEYLIPFCQRLKLPGNIYLADFPMDGTNIQGKLDLEHWKQGLIDLVKTFNYPILVTHSFSGMLVLNLPEIENYLKGLILMNTTTQNSFFQHVSAMQEKHGLPDLLPPASAYHLDPTRETYKDFWKTYKHYCYTPEEMLQGERMIKTYAFNNDAYYYVVKHFYADYTVKFQPKSIPVMTIASENDFICPPDVFMQDERFQSKNITNKMIKKAGHCPWLVYFKDVQNCFDEFVQNFKNQT